MSNELEKFVARNREAFNDNEPNPLVLQRLQAQMGMTDKKKGILVSFRAIRWAAACVILLAGLGIFYIARNDANPAKMTPMEPLAKNTVKDSAPVNQPAQNETGVDASIDNSNGVQQAAHKDNGQSQLMARKLALFAKLNDMASAGTRVEAATEINKLKNVDRDVIDALVTTMNSDPNTNVRLAALDALTRFHRENYVKQQMIKSLKKQSDAMVQIQLIQTLTKMREKSIVSELEKLVKDESTMDAVKDNAYSGIMVLKS